MISKFPVHGTGCSDSYNFLVLQRRDVILSGINLQARADQTILKCVQNTSFMITKIKSKFENLWIERPPFVEQLPLYTILLFGCNHSTSHVNDTWARRKALKSRQRANFMNLEARTPHQRQYFGKFMISKFPVHGTGCSDSYNFLASQRPAVILCENEIHARADQTN